MNIIVSYLVIINTLHSINTLQFDYNMNWMSPVNNRPTISSRQLSQSAAPRLPVMRAKPTCGPVSFPDYSCEGPTSPLPILKRSDGQKMSKPQEELYGQLLQPQILRSSYEIEKTPWKPNIGSFIHSGGREFIKTFKKDVTTWKSMIYPRANPGKLVGSLFDSILDKNDYITYEEAESPSTQPSEIRSSGLPLHNPQFRSQPLNQPNVVVHQPIPQNIPVNRNIMFRNNNMMLTSKTDRHSLNGVPQHVMSGSMTSRYIQPQMNFKFRVSAQFNPYRNIPISTSRGITYKYNPVTYSQPPVGPIKGPYQGPHIKLGILGAHTNQNTGIKLASTQRYFTNRVNFFTVTPMRTRGDNPQRANNSVIQLFQTAFMQNTLANARPITKKSSKASENVPSRDSLFQGMGFQYTSSRFNPEKNTRNHHIIRNTLSNLATDDLPKHETTTSFLKQEDLQHILNFNNDVKEKSVGTMSQDGVATNSSPHKLLSDKLQTRSSTVNNVFDRGMTLNINYGGSFASTAKEIVSDDAADLRAALDNISPQKPILQLFSDATQIPKVNYQSQDKPNITWSSQDTTPHYDFNGYTVTTALISNSTVPNVSNIMSSSVSVQGDPSERTMFDNNNKETWSQIESENNGATTFVDKSVQSVMLDMAAGPSFETKIEDGPTIKVLDQNAMQYRVTSDNVAVTLSDISPGVTADGNVMFKKMMSRDDKLQSETVDLTYTEVSDPIQISTTYRTMAVDPILHSMTERTLQ